MSSAWFSDCGRYRYTLHRRFLVGDGTVAFVMLNPSTADATEDDPTVRRCTGYAMAWGFDHLVVLNLFALRSTDPSILHDADDPIGPENDRAFRDTLPGCRSVVCAWGNHGTLHGRNRAAVEMIIEAGHAPTALTVTRSGQPQHPLYLAKTLRPVEYRP